MKKAPGYAAAAGGVSKPPDSEIGLMINCYLGNHLLLKALGNLRAPLSPTLGLKKGARTLKAEGGEGGGGGAVGATG